jgi:hypothetical protein
MESIYCQCNEHGAGVACVGWLFAAAGLTFLSRHSGEATNNTVTVKQQTTICCFDSSSNSSYEQGFEAAKLFCCVLQASFGWCTAARCPRGAVQRDSAAATTSGQLLSTAARSTSLKGGGGNQHMLLHCIG